MTSYLRYKAQIAICDADDDIESWITVRGNHIPIKKGQSKEEAVKSFIESKGEKEKGGDYVSAGREKAKREAGHEFKKRSGVGIKFTEYDPEFETVRKNALANSNVYGGKYTQKSKAEAYKEYKNDTSSKENMKKANEFVNGSGNTQKPTPAEEHTTTRTILTMFHKHYDDLYDGKTKHNASLVKEFDDKMAKDPEFKKQVQAFVRERGDVLSSDREVEAYMLAYNTTKNKLEPANKKLADFHEKANKTSQPKDIMNWKFEDVMKLPASDPRVHEYIAKNNGLKVSTVSTIAEGFGSTEDLYFEIDRISDRKGYGWDKIKGSGDSADTKKRWSADWKKINDKN